MPKSIDTLDLVELPIEDRQFAADPNPWLAKARDRHPWAARFSHGYMIHGHHAIREIMLQDDKLQIAIGAIVDIMGAEGTEWGQFMKDLMIGMRGADHKRVRGSVEPFFKPRSVMTHLGSIRQVIGQLLDDWAPRTQFDFADFASNFPITVMFGLIGADAAALPRIKWALEAQGLSFSLDPSLLPDLKAAHALMMQFNDELIVQRRRSGEKRDDLLQALIEAEDAGVLTPKEARELLFFLFGAGYDTSKNQLTLTVHMLMQRPDLWERCAADRQYCSLAVEEGFRMASPSNVPRIVLADIVYDDVLIPRGQHLIFLLNVAGRDPASFPNPLTYDPGRDHVNRHVAFGMGEHKCLGMHLARLQIEEGLHLIAQRLECPELAGDVRWRRFPGVWGIEALPIRFTLRQGALVAAAK